MPRKSCPEEPLERKPRWLRAQAPGGESYLRIARSLRRLNLHTVCEEARCPNKGECWGGGTATYMLLGDTCTRACRFCAVASGNPHGKVDAGEPRRLADSVAGLGLRYLVLTTVDRDDLADGGASWIAAAVRAVREREPSIVVEVLTGDFRGDGAAVAAVLGAAPDVFAHNIETVERLTPRVRDRRASYRLSLEVLRSAKALRPGVSTKSSLMLGLGETEEEVLASMRDLRASAVDYLTVGQYLRPSLWNLAVVEYVAPERFARLERAGREMGFAHVAAAPLVRSSYRAGEHFVAAARARERGA